MLISILANYIFGILIQKSVPLQKLLLILSIIFNISILFIFKYLNFSVSILNQFTHSNIKVPQISLPVGISFFTFQIMSYVIDVYKKDIKAQTNIVKLALYISFFPQLIAGPIVRYIDIEKQINDRDSTLDGVYEGIRRFVIGFSKKILIADQLSYLVDPVFSNIYPSILCYWVGIIAYTLQIYFDFSGYSDMAIGLGKVFGFDFLENFNYPYISKSIQEFWRRWHISLSSWFRDYVYYSTGGSRVGTLRTYINLFIVFFLTGLWHGASFNFIVWGLYYAIFLVIERLGFKRVLAKLPGFIQHIYAIIIVMIGWIFFKADNLGCAIQYIKNMFVPAGNDLVTFQVMMNLQYWFCLLLGIICSIPITKKINLIRNSKIGATIIDALTIIVFIIAICYMVGSGYSPFLYFRF